MVQSAQGSAGTMRLTKRGSTGSGSTLVKSWEDSMQMQKGTMDLDAWLRNEDTRKRHDEKMDAD